MKIIITELAREKIITQTPKDMNNPIPAFVWMLSKSPNNYIQTSNGFKKAVDGYWKLVLGWYEREDIRQEGIILACGIELAFDPLNLKDNHNEAIIDYINHGRSLIHIYLGTN